MSEPKRHRTAGGVVINDAGEMLVLVRDVLRDGVSVHEVRLPKGHIDEGETEEGAARREVQEESGYGGVEIVDDLGSAVSEFHFKGRAHIRTERYFLMRLTDPKRGAPAPTHADEALFQPAWLAPEDAAAQLTYESEQGFARRAIKALQPPSRKDRPRWC